jgi:formylglycine-generating enzyme required for sulfatase activity
VFAATNGDNRKFAWGNDPPDASRANVADTSYSRLARARGMGENESAALHAGNDGFAATAPVGRFSAGASPFGVLDMSGNVSEWLEGSDNPPSNTILPGAPTIRPVRGGNYMTSHPDMLLVHASSGWGADVQLPSVGFRCARTPAG